MSMQPELAAQIAALEAQAARAVQGGREQEAIDCWIKILDIDTAHVRSLTALGQRAYRGGQFDFARNVFAQLVEVDGSDSAQWVNLALACQALKDEAGEEYALRGALTADPVDLVSLILRANLLERRGDKHQAAHVYGAAASVAPPIARLAPELRPALTHAMAYKSQYQHEYGAFMDQFLAPHYRQYGGENLQRFRESIDIVTGRKRRYESKSMLYHYPGLVPAAFFERADFPWLDALEAGTGRIRDEFLAVLAADAGFTPYLTYADDVPHNQFAELNNSPRWSAFHLFKMGQRVEENAAQCPHTMQLLEGVPSPDQPGRTPAAMFSLLKPKTRIPPHTGVSNARLVAHLPLIVPGDCGFRVGNETREWVPGKAWVFDDTIEHEAWNNSDKLRVVLIFDLWHPHLSPPERAMITAMTAGMNAFLGGAGGFEL